MPNYDRREYGEPHWKQRYPRGSSVAASVADLRIIQRRALSGSRGNVWKGREDLVDYVSSSLITKNTWTSSTHRVYRVLRRVRLPVYLLDPLGRSWLRSA